MAEQEEPAIPEKLLNQDALVEKLLPDPSQEHPNVRVLVGYLGRSPEAGHWRLYLTPTLDRYVEISEEDIVHNQSLASEQNALGGTMLWVKQDASIVLHTRTDLRQAQAQFLQGEIATGMQGMTGGRAASFGAQRLLEPFTFSYLAAPTPCWPCIPPIVPLPLTPLCSVFC